MSKKKRKPRWTVSYAMQDAAWRMIVDVRGQIAERPDGYLFRSETMTDRGTITFEAQKSYAMDGKGLSNISCSFKSRFENASTNCYLIRDSWENIKTWLMDDNNIEEVAKTLDGAYNHTHSWD